MADEIKGGPKGPEDGGTGDNASASRRGLRKDGKPYKEGNTREDGSFAVGKNRPDPTHQFREGDGRPRGRREKGVPNLGTVWRKALKRRATHQGETRTELEWTVHRIIQRSKIKSDRAAEIVLRYATELELRQPRVDKADSAIVEAYFAELMATLTSDAAKDGSEHAGDAKGGNGSDEEADDGPAA